MPSAIRMSSVLRLLTLIAILIPVAVMAGPASGHEDYGRGRLEGRAMAQTIDALALASPYSTCCGCGALLPVLALLPAPEPRPIAFGRAGAIRVLAMAQGCTDCTSCCAMFSFLPWRMSSRARQVSSTGRPGLAGDWQSHRVRPTMALVGRSADYVRGYTEELTR